MPYRVWAYRLQSSVWSSRGTHEHGEGAAFSRRALDDGSAAMGLGDVLHDGQSESRTAEAPTARLVNTIESLEDFYEPYLIQKGYLKRTPRGRMVTPLAYDLLAIPHDRKTDENQGILF